MLRPWVRRHWPALRFVALQWLGFVVMVALGWAWLGHPRPGHVDWVVTGAYGATTASIAVVAAWRRQRAALCCGVAFFCLGWVVSACIVALNPGFIAHAPITFMAVAAVCSYHTRKTLTALAVALAAIHVIELLIFGPVIGPDEGSGVAVTVHQLLFVGWIVVASIDALRPAAPDPVDDAAETSDRHAAALDKVA